MIGVPNEERVKIAVMYVTGKAEYWWRGTCCNANTLPWHHFCRMVTDRFNLSYEYEIVGQFHNLKQIGSVTDYVDHFEEMVSMVKRHNPSLSDNYFIISFVSGLKDNIQCHLQCHKPTSLSQAYWFAKRLEQPTHNFRKFSTYTNQPKIVKPEFTENKDKSLPAQTLAELKAAGKCFKCREPWVPGHSKLYKAKQIYSVILGENEEGTKEIAVIEDLDPAQPTQQSGEFQVCKLPVQALTGTPSRVGTFTLKLQIKGQTAIALVDSGSDASFINSKFAIRTKLPITNVDPVKVVAAQDKVVFSSTACQACQYIIQGHNFISDFRLYDLQGYDIILGADWIYQHSPVGLDLRRREFSITKEGVDIVTFVDETIPDSKQVIGAKQLHKLLKKKAIGAVIVLNNSSKQNTESALEIPVGIVHLLSEYADIFQEPTRLPPPRSVDHSIPLI
jgi:hypothetical protein